MSNLRLYLAIAALIGTSIFGSTAARAGARHPGTSLAGSAQIGIGKQEPKNSAQNKDTEDPADDNDKAKGTPVVVLITDLVADLPQLTDRNHIVHSPATLDPHLVNPWGLTESAASPFWVSDNNAGVSTLYNVPGANNTPVSIVPLVVSIPTPLDLTGGDGTPTGTVFNVDLGGGGFKITDGTHTAPAVFLFATEDGTIVGWNPTVDPTGKFDGPNGFSRHGVLAVDNSGGQAANGAVYKGLAIAKDAGGTTLLYAANFRAGTIEVYDTSFKPATTLPPDAFTDPDLPPHYAPFNVTLNGGVLFVTYARQDKARHDPVAGHGRGFVNTFDLSGNMLSRFASRGQLDAPWGVVRAPASFGQSAGEVLIGNFGDGEINAFDPTTGEFLGKAVNSKGEVILIDGLWALMVGNGKAGGDSDKIYFTAGPNGETDGLFGSLTSVPLGSPCGIPCR